MIYQRFWNGVNYHTKHYDSKLKGNSHFARVSTYSSGFHIAVLEKFAMIDVITVAEQQLQVPVVFYQALNILGKLRTGAYEVMEPPG
jgi:hypothetical protein